MYENQKLVVLISLVICYFPSMGLGQAKHFVLVHGSCHGAWSWYKAVPLLKSGGHKVTAIDLAGSGVDPKQVNTLRSISDYTKPLREFMASLPIKEKVVLVAHSLGGLAISQAMKMFSEKISVAVFVTATMPGPTLNALNDQDSQMDNSCTYDDDGLPTTFTFGPMFLCSEVCQLSPPQDCALASMVMRPIHLYSEEDMSRELVLSQEKYGSVNRGFIISEKDMVSKEDFVRYMIQENPPHQVQVIEGSDHMVMMSKPIQLCNLLSCIAKRYN